MAPPPIIVIDLGSFFIVKTSFEYIIFSELVLIFSNIFGFDPVAIIKF